MPKIVQYEAKDAALHPSDLGDAAYTQAARRAGAFYEQMATGTREVGNLQKELDDDVGRSLTGFLRLKGLEDQAGDINVKVTGNGGARTLIGTGSQGPQNYARLNELANGPHYLSRVARDAVASTSPIQDTVENGVNVLRGGADKGQSDVENGVTVLRGGSGPMAAQDPFANLGQRGQVSDSLANAGGTNNPFASGPNYNIPYSQPDPGGFPLPIQSGDQLPAAGSLANQSDTYSNGFFGFGAGVPASTAPQPATPQQSAIPIEQDSAPSMWSDIGDNQ